MDTVALSWPGIDQKLSELDRKFPEKDLSALVLRCPLLTFESVKREVIVLIQFRTFSRLSSSISLLRVNFGSFIEQRSF